MQVRHYLSQHETAKQLPLLTESATVTEIEGMARSRNDAVVRTIENVLDRSGGIAWKRERPADERACRR